jgi:hypothetical protein
MAEAQERVEALFARLKTPAWQQAGLMRARRWAPGKSMSEGELRAALAAWLSSPAGK